MTDSHFVDLFTNRRCSLIRTWSQPRTSRPSLIGKEGGREGGIDGRRTQHIYFTPVLIVLPSLPPSLPPLGGSQW